MSSCTVKMTWTRKVCIALSSWVRIDRWECSKSIPVVRTTNGTMTSTFLPFLNECNIFLDGSRASISISHRQGLRNSKNIRLTKFRVKINIGFLHIFFVIMSVWATTGMCQFQVKVKTINFKLSTITFCIKSSQHWRANCAWH
jgi:hypothetical protein